MTDNDAGDMGMQDYIISLVVAVSRNGVIAVRGDLPWHLPSDLAIFKRETVGRSVIMGRRTWDSLYIRPLPDRYNIVVTRRLDWGCEGAVCAHSLSSAIELAKAWSDESGVREVCIIGGGEIYAQSLSFAHKLCVSRVDGDFEGDVFFRFDESDWLLDKRVHYARAGSHSHDFDYCEYRRK